MWPVYSALVAVSMIFSTGNLAHDDLDLDLRQQRGVHLGAAVLLAAALLQAAAHDLGHRHAGNADVVQRLLQRLKLGKLHDDGNLVHAGIQPGGQRGVLDVTLTAAAIFSGLALVMSSSPRSVFSFTSSSA